MKMEDLKFFVRDQLKLQMDIISGDDKNKYLVIRNTDYIA